MGYFERFVSQFRARLSLIILVNNVLILAGWYVVDHVLELTGWQELAGVAVIPLFTIVMLPWLTADALTQPTRFLWQAIMHLSPDAAEAPAPQPAQLHLGRELVTNLVSQLYQFTSVVQNMERAGAKAAQDLHANFVANHLPLPFIALASDDQIVYANEATGRYLGKPAGDLTGQNVYTALDMSFTSAGTLHDWLDATRGKAAMADHSWERVRIGLPGSQNSKQFDLAAHYSQGNPSGYETLLVLFDHTDTYGQDDQGLGFVALAVHELRTPLTLLRGYIEVFNVEIGAGLDPELQRFMKQMDAAAEQLTAFVSNILNVAKVEDNQLTLQLHEEKWPDMIDSVAKDLTLRAGVRGLTIKTEVAGDLPAAGVDRYSMYELLANLLDNAIKYSKDKGAITIRSTLNKDGLIETSVHDDGIGVDSSILPYIFDKFYRSHQSRSQIGGTGLGLYLAKVIVEAHGGNIWVQSKADEGSTFTFTVIPYDKLEDGRKAGGDKSITRSAHGWIKNHSMYRD
ncbi:MAG TPA: ATP-binding protein [Candidatus Saccharimonadales bacterium]|jgi:signal transduction histidine kinase